MAKDFITEQLKKEFKGRETFSRAELLTFYKRFEPDLKDTTFRWRIYHLKDKKIITPLSKGVFSFTYKPLFKPEIGEKERKLYTKIEKQFPGLKLCIWSTKAVNEFMLHQPGRFFTILEVEQEALDPVFHYLKDLNTPEVFFQPVEKEMERYINEAESPIILESLISKAPTQPVQKVVTITVEKLIVDIYCDKNLFNVFQGSELINIVNSIYRRYAVDLTKLFNYAKRRRREAEIMDFLLQQTDIPKNILND